MIIYYCTDIIINNIKRSPHSGNAYDVAKVLKALDVNIKKKSK